jgi:hypothetical protein
MEPTRQAIVRAVLITLVITWQVVEAAPFPHVVNRDHLRSPVGQEQLGWWSADEWWRTGRGAGDPGRLVPAWPRYLLVLQVVLVYFTAGVQKFATQWWPWGGYSALYLILNDWAVSRYHLAWLGRQPFYLSTQIGTATTVLWQWTYPVVLVHYFPGPGAPGRLRRLVEAGRLHLVWLAVGVIFHVSIGLTMELGIFPWGFLAVYPAFLHPDEVRGVFRRVGARAIQRAAG